MIPEQKSETARLVVRRFSGPAADEIYVQCRPATSQQGNVARQTTSIYQALGSLLRGEKGSLGHVVYETAFFRNIRKDFEHFQEARLEIFDAEGLRSNLPASTFIEQPPLDAQVDLVLSVVAVVPRRSAVQGSKPAYRGSLRSFSLGEQRHSYAGSIYGTPGSVFDETFSMFCRAEELLKQEGMGFQNVIRTWIYLRHMERDYAEFNRGRREFFRQRNVTLLPASTGINGSPFPEQANILLSICALKSPRGLESSAMTTPTLNEACTYGSDFSRGLRVVEENKVALYVSGTASVDERGHTAHVGNFEAQIDRMLLNVETLLSAQKASFGNVLAAVTYLKSPDDAPSLRRILHERGLDGMPNAEVHAAVCRPDLLCEMEAIAALPLP